MRPAANRTRFPPREAGKNYLRRPPQRRLAAGLPPWAHAGLRELAEELETDVERGLSASEAQRRLAIFGPNELGGKKPISPWRLLASQLTDFMVLVLLGATAISFFLGETADAVAILAIVVLNAVLGFVQEYRAERAMERLAELAAPTARVLRSGSPVAREVPAREVVPGDIILLEEGDRVPADVRLLEAHILQTQEAALTGESTPVHKSTAPPPPGRATTIGDLDNAAFMGTEVASGRGRGLAVATGMETEFGRIAGLIQGAGGDPTPLQRRLQELGRYLVLGCLGISGLVVWAGVLRGENPYDMFLAGVSLAVAAIPEGLPAVVTIVLALGVQRMIKRNVIVRKLPAVETLGCATMVCSDKTGTLTENEMTVRYIWTPTGTFRLTGQGYSSRGGIHPAGSGGARSGHSDRALRLLLTAGCLCTNAHVEKGAGGRTEVHGDPTEGALLVAAAKAGLDRAALEGRFPRTAELPFSSERRRMTTVHHPPSDKTALVLSKGAPDTLLEHCTHYEGPGGPVPLAGERKSRVLGVAARMASSGLRVLALAYGRTTDTTPDPGPEVEQGLVLVGLAGMSDPPRPEVKGAVATCHRAGVKVSMITGDHPATAVAVARELHLLDDSVAPERQVITGRELDQLSDRALSRRIGNLRVFARVSPGHKLKIVRALRRRGEVVAMTGDGVNDAPAVREADIGVAMGRTGTAVTKEASDMVLVDDNFASIVAALEEGRVIYDNIRRFIRSLLACNTGEILTMLLGALLRLPLPLLPIQILMVNLATDGLPAMALGLQAPETDVAQRPPRPPGEGIFARRLGVKIAGRGVIIGLSTVAVFLLALRSTGWDLVTARTVAFATLVLSQLVHAFDCRSERKPLSEVPLSSNWYLVGATALSFAMLLAVVYLPALQPFFQTMPLGPREWFWVVAASVWGQAAVGLRRILIFGGLGRRARRAA